MTGRLSRLQALMIQRKLGLLGVKIMNLFIGKLRRQMTSLLLLLASYRSSVCLFCLQLEVILRERSRATKLCFGTDFPMTMRKHVVDYGEDSKNLAKVITAITILLRVF